MIHLIRRRARAREVPMKRMNVLQKTILVTIGVFEVFRLLVQFLVPYPILANTTHCGPWIASLVSKPAIDPCRIAASPRIREAVLETVLGVALGFVLALVAGAWRTGGGGGGGGGEPPAGDDPRDPSPRPLATPV